jgi:acetoin utilization deacetylase AcuC-like enzyme
MRIFYTDHFVLPLPEGHRFPMQKYALLRHKVAEARLGDLAVPHAATDTEISRAHDVDYLSRVQGGALTAADLRRIGFPWSSAMVERSRRSSGATIEAARAALTDGIAVSLAGGTHHAYPDHGEGFCVFNDSAIAARALQAEGLVRRVVILDCDVHQGNGTAAILAEDDSVFTFSIHGAKNFPLHKEKSDLDLELADRADDRVYLEAVEWGVGRALDWADADLAIYLAGADPFADDRLGRLAVSKDGLARRDWLVLEMCRERGLPVAITMAGGYARHLADTVDIHFQTVVLAAQCAAQSALLWAHKDRR